MSVSTAGRSAEPRASGRQSTRYVAIDGLRGVAALALLFTHVAMIQGLIGTKELGGRLAPSNLLGGFFASGLQIVAGVFFVLTGLLLYRPLAKAVITDTKMPEQGPNFLRRALRLLPAYYVMFVIVLLTLNFHAIDSAWYVLRYVLLVQVYDFVWVNGMEVMWTVPDMAQFYLLLPLLGWATHKYARRGATPRARAYRLMLPVPIMIGAGFGWLFFVKAMDMGTRALFWWPMGLLPEVGIGMGLAIMLVLKQVSPKDTPKLLHVAKDHPNLFLGGALAAVIINCARPFSEIGMDDIYTIPGLLIFYILLAVFGLCMVLPLVAGKETRLIRGMFTNKPILYLGKVSYGIYLWHFAVMHFYLGNSSLFGGQSAPLITLRGSAGFWELELVTLAGATIMASISYYLLERPIMNWGDRYLERRDKRKGVVPSQRRESMPV